MYCIVNVRNVNILMDKLFGCWGLKHNELFMKHSSYQHGSYQTHSMAVPIAFDESATIPHYLVISALFMKIPHSNPCQQTRIFISIQQLLDSYFYLLMDRRFTLVEERQNSVQPWNKQVKNRAILT